MSDDQSAEHEQKIATAQTARLFHLHAIEQHEEALKYHRDAAKYHSLGDVANAEKNALLAQAYTLQVAALCRSTPAVSRFAGSKLRLGR
jgi:hypothetical protein